MDSIIPRPGGSLCMILGYMSTSRDKFDKVNPLRNGNIVAKYTNRQTNFCAMYNIYLNFVMKYFTKYKIHH